MNPKIKALWLKALRSGKYKQGQEYLKQNTAKKGVQSYCCLGVLCDITDDSKWQGGRNDDCYRYLGRDGMLPDKLRRGFGITPTQQEDLANLNDEYRPDRFKRTAKYIEENL